LDYLHKNKRTIAMEVKIVNCTLKHRAVLAELGASTFYESYKDENTEEDMQQYIQSTYAIEKIEENLGDTNVIYFLAYTYDGEAGYVKLLLNQFNPKLNGSCAELEKIYVRKSFQRKGIAHQLLMHTIQFCKTHQYKNLYLGVWQQNFNALAFYEKEGFKTFDERKFNLGDRICDDFMLNLEL
jgi:diamine N-acetyltransferase